MKIIVKKNKIIFDWVLIAKGIGIILVVIGHFSPKLAPNYWVEIIKIIYSFHMPLFFLLSGFLFNNEKYSYLMLIKLKIKRLLYPFISIATIFFIIKYSSGLIFNLENPVKIGNVFSLLSNPLKSYMPLLWFIYALFMIFLIYPILRRIIHNNYIILIIIIMLNIICSNNNYPIIGNALLHIPYFIVGVIFREDCKLRNRILFGKMIYIIISGAMFFFIYFIFHGIELVSTIGYIVKFMLGASGAICVINISYMLEIKNFFSAQKWLLTQIGFYSMSIYLFHTLFESAIRIISYQVLLAEFPLKFIVIALTAIISGIIFPIILEKMILRKNRFTKKYMLGLE